MAKREGILCISTILFLPLDTGFKLSNMPMTRFPKQAWIMLRTVWILTLHTKTAVGQVVLKDCLE